MTMEQQPMPENNSGLEQLFEQQKQAFKACSFPSYEQRKQHLQALYDQKRL
ncbi:hypothetical protein [Acinetobacter pragensis]|uniref:hypothetical protein n=1 Tax=Acinetobacter pragensis TaxID=1806892 RepID=UPI0013966A8E|nr:hypothetical protein [Acinetobacter pragensis]